MALPGEHLGLYHATFPRHIVPPLMAAIVLNTRPPMYLFGWRYPYKQFLRQVINAPYLTPQEIWDHSVAEPFAEKFPHLAKCVHNVCHPVVCLRNSAIRYVPLLYVDPETRRCTVIIVTNSDGESREMAKNEEVIEGLRPILKESREPCWFRYP